MTVKDADTLGSGLRVCKKLRVVKIANSKMDDDRFYTIYDGIKNLNHLGNQIYGLYYYGLVFIIFYKENIDIKYYYF